jgi:hypothetical protein
MTHAERPAFLHANAVMSKRQELWHFGYRSVAVYTKDKRPFGIDWTGRARRNPPEAANVPPFDDALNTGILCDGLQAVDIDIDDHAKASEVEQLAKQLLGLAPVRKRADSARVLLPYRAAHGEPGKRKIEGAYGKVEVLGRGQQFVAYGLHPSGTPYQWDFDPSLCSRDLLSVIDERQLTAFLQAIAPIIGAKAEDAWPSDAPSLIPFDPTHPLSERDRIYAAQALRLEYEKLAALSCGRNNALNNATFAMGTLVANGSIEESAVRDALYHAMITNGYVAKHGEKVTLGTLNSGLNAGKTKPRSLIAQADLVPVTIAPNAFRIRSETPKNSKPLHLSEPLNPVRDGKRSVTLLRGFEIEAKPLHWLWHGFLPSGKLTILAGAGGTGKSTLAFGLAAIVTSAGMWPDGTRCSAPGNVLIWSSEDDPADTIKPRMTAAGADASRYGVIEGTHNERGDKGPFDPATDMEALREAVKGIGGISLLIIDPIVSAVTGDMHKANDVRRNLQAIIDFAVEFHCAVLGISHFAKATAGRNPTERVIGSQAFSALARMVLVTAKDEATNNRVFTRAKSNNSLDGGGFSYSIEALELPTGTATRVVWGAAIEGTSREILSQIEGDGSAEGHGAMNEAKQFLVTQLENGAVEAKELLSRARDLSISEKTLRRAQKQLGVQARKEGYQGEWVWMFPFNPSAIMHIALPKVAPSSADGGSKVVNPPKDAQPEGFDHL